MRGFGRPIGRGNHQWQGQRDHRPGPGDDGSPSQIFVLIFASKNIVLPQNEQF